MALKIRLRQQGRKNSLVYRLVLADVRSPRDGKYIESLGWYHPRAVEGEQQLCVDSARVLHWLERGAILTEKADKLVQRVAPEVSEMLRKRAEKAREKAQQERAKAK